MQETIRNTLSSSEKKISRTTLFENLQGNTHIRKDAVQFHKESETIRGIASSTIQTDLHRLKPVIRNLSA